MDFKFLLMSVDEENTYISINNFAVKVESIYNYSPGSEESIEGLIFFIRFFVSEICEFQIFADVNKNSWL